MKIFITRTSCVVNCTNCSFRIRVINSRHSVLLLLRLTQEKTYVMRVINIITAVCLVLSVLEIFMAIKKLQSSYRKSK